MKRFVKIVTQVSLLVVVVVMQNSVFADDHAITPQIMTKADIAGEMFSRPNMIETPHPGGPTLDVTSLLSSDEKFSSGMYKAGPSRFEITEPYGVDEFMYVLEGSIKLTSFDGSVQIIKAGDAVTIPKECTGIWETEGYRKIWVIYSATGGTE